LDNTLRQYQHIVSATPDHILLLDQNYVYQIVNTAYVEHTGREYNNIVGHSAAEIMGQEFFTKVLKPRLDRALTGETVRFQAWFTYAQSNRCFMDVTSIPFRESEPGQITGVLVYARDITVIKQAEEALRKSEQRYRNLFEASPDAIFLAEHDTGRLIVANPAAERLLQRERHQLIGTHQADLHPPEQAGFVRQAFQKLGSNDPPLACDVQRADGSRIPVEICGRRVTDGDRALALGIFHDISHRTSTEAALKESESRYRLVTELVSDFAYAAQFYPGGQYQLLWITDAFERIYGVSHDSLAAAGGSFLDFIHPADMPRLEQEMKQRIDHGGAFEVEYRIINASGQTRWLYDRSRALGWQGPDKPVQVVGAVQDITARKEVESILLFETFFNRSVASLSEEILSPDLSIERITAIVHRVALELTGSEHGYVSSIDVETGENISRSVSRSNFDGSPVALASIFSGEEAGYSGLWGLKLNDGRPFFSNAPVNLPAAGGSPGGDLPLHNYLWVPVVVEENLFGQIALANAPEGFMDADLQNIKRIANIYALAIMRKRNESDLVAARQTAETASQARQVALEQAETMYRSLLALSAATSLPDVLRLILEELRRLVPYDTASVQVLRDNYFEIIDGAGFNDIDNVIGRRFFIKDDSVEQRMIATRRPVLIDDINTLRWAAFPPGEASFCSWLAVPLIFRDRIIGMLGIDKAEPAFFTERHAEVAMAFAAQAAITIENAQLFENMEKAHHQAETANQAKSRFLANMSHELRTPLNGILGYAQLLRQDTTLSDQQRQAISTIERSGQYLLLLINDVLDLSKIESGRMSINPTEIDLFHFLETLVDIIRLQTQQKGLHFYYAPAPDLPRAVRADETRLRQILLNLLSNAVRFTEQGQITFRVSVLPSRGAVTTTFSPAISAGGNDPATQPNTPDTKSWVNLKFEVEDTGTGIDPRDHDAIFQAFKQVEHPSRGTGGTGLGLSITRRLVTMMSGEIQLTSALGQGSCFTVLLPLPVTAPSNNTLPTGDSRQIVGYHHPDGQRTILMVDDSLDTLAILRDLLMPLNFKLVEATTGESALLQAPEASPHLILMDLLLPGVDGYETVHRLHATTALADVPVIAISAEVSEQMIRDSIAAGFVDFIAKPFSLDVLFHSIGRALNITWLYDRDRSSATKDRPAQLPEMRLPPLEMLKVLYSLVIIGDIKGVQDWLGDLSDQPASVEYTHFINHVTNLADEYCLNEIETWLEQKQPEILQILNE
jgi:PAS domain S-box-containing protein